MWEEGVGDYIGSTGGVWMSQRRLENNVKSQVSYRLRTSAVKREESGAAQSDAARRRFYTALCHSSTHSEE
jgi:hypothetical protein